MTTRQDGLIYASPPLTIEPGSSYVPGSKPATYRSTAAMSYVHGATDKPLLGDTIGNAFDRTVAIFGERPGLYVRQQNIRWNYRELGGQIDEFAAGLVALGLLPGERIAIWAPNCAEWVVAQFATAKLGLILVNINPAYRLSELEYALRKVGCRALISATRFKTSDYIGMLHQLLPELPDAIPGRLESRLLPRLEIVIQIGTPLVAGTIPFGAVQAMADNPARHKLAVLARRLQFDDPINIQFTSGTTGAPKGATLSHHNILNNGFFLGEAMRFTEHDRVCIPVPLYHCFGMVIGNLACITHGSMMVFPGEGFDPLATLQTVAEERCTALYGVPTMFIAELEHKEFSSFDLSSLRTGMMAGAPCPAEVMRKCVETMHLSEITIGYGMTETSPVSFQTAIGDPEEKQVATVGRIHPHIEVKIIDADGRIVPRGQPGELCTRGYSVMRGYWGDPERTAETIDAARWMHTGDLATIDAEGYCQIVGRIKDLVIRGGENIYPREVEEYLYRHEKIMEVQVFGVPDARFGEEICAWIQIRDGMTLTAKEVQEFCDGQIAHYKVPRHIRFVTEFPMTVTGKMQKFLMREAMVAELGTA
jgi:fatty-acyl-CoA synthase